MSNPESRSAICFVCDKLGNVAKVLRDDINLFDGPNAPGAFLLIFGNHNIDRATLFWAQMQTDIAVGDWELNIKLKNCIKTYIVSGVVAGESVVISAWQKMGLFKSAGVTPVIAKSEAGVLNDYKSHFGWLASTNSLGERELLNKMSALNNEMVNMQRQSVKQNARIKKLNNNLQQLNEDLNNNKLSLETANEKLTESNIELQRARKEADDANGAKSLFLANMSHELRTPMNAIIGFTDLVLTTAINSSQRVYLQHVHRSGYNLLDIINDILDLSKIEAGKFVIDHIAFRPDRLIEEIADMLAIKAFEKNIELICEVEPSFSGEVMGDPGRLQQIVVNLLGNAIKFTEKGEIVISLKKGAITLGDQDEQFQSLIICVKDTGIGISSEKIAMVFESFTQADAVTTRKYGGTGLGLTIAKNLAEMMGGSLTVKSEPGKGCTFILELVLKVVPDELIGPAILRPALRRVLVVDDNLTNCHLMKDIFDYLTIDCIICNNGMDALKLLVQSIGGQRMFDLIITDHQMPAMDGITLVKEIKKILREGPQPFILMLSSLERSMCMEDAEKVGINLFLSKPVKLHELQNILQSIFEKNEPVEMMDSQRPTITRLTEHATVLVAEDEPVNMLLISEVLNKMGFKVLQAANGREAIDLLNEHHPDIIFMDINMPEMDGIEATKAIRSASWPQSNIPIIALTADAMTEDRDRCREAGMNNFVSKPFRIGEIEKIVRDYAIAS